jgi:thiamine transporter
MTKTVLARTEKTKRLALSGILIAMATVLSFIKVFEWPFGGSVTAASMLPLAMLGYTYGMKWGMLSGLVHGILQAVLGASMSQAFAGMNAGSAVAILCLDYLLAFSVIGLSGMFKGKIKNHTVALVLGTVIAVLARYLVHTVSGYIFYASYADWFFGEAFVNSFSSAIVAACPPKMLGLVYSVIYNGSYMIPEVFITAIPAAIIFTAVPPIRREMIKTR